MVKTLKSRLVAYRANGSKLGLLPEPASYTVSFTHDAVGALTVSYSRKALRGEILDRRLETGLEIAVEVSDGGRWLNRIMAGSSSPHVQGTLWTCPTRCR